MVDIFVDDRKRDAAPNPGLNRGPNWITILALAAVLFLAARGWIGPSPRPDDPPTPDPRKSSVTHVCAIGGLVSVRSTHVARFLHDAGVEFRRYSPENRPENAEPEFLKLFDAGADKAPVIMYLDEKGNVTETPMPKTADELMVYLKDKIDA